MEISSKDLPVKKRVSTSQQEVLESVNQFYTQTFENRVLGSGSFRGFSELQVGTTRTLILETAEILPRAGQDRATVALEVIRNMIRNFNRQNIHPEYRQFRIHPSLFRELTSTEAYTENSLRTHGIATRVYGVPLLQDVTMSENQIMLRETDGR